MKKNVNIMERITKRRRRSRGRRRRRRRRRGAGNYKILKNHKSEEETGGVRGGEHAAKCE